MADPTNDAARAQALLSQARGSTACVGPKAPTQRRSLRLKSLWTGLALSGLVAGALHFMGGHPAPEPTPHAAPATHATAAIVHGTPAHQALTAAPVAAPRAQPAPAAPVITPVTPAAPPAAVAPTPSVSAAPAASQAHPSAPAVARVLPSVTVAAPATVPAPAPTAAAAPSTHAGSGLLKLPVTVTPDDTTLTLSKKLSDAGEFFPALATSLEQLKLRTYYDGGGENIAMGYCLTVREAVHGRQQVHDELLHAGIPAKDVAALMSPKRKVQQTVQITTENALRLLYIVMPEYEAIARDAVGPTFEKLPKNRQAAVTWLAYNTGDVASFKQLVHGVQHDNMRQAMEHMTPWFRDTDNQVMVKNERAGAYLQGAYYSEAGLKKVIDNPAAFEDQTLVHKQSPIAAVDPTAAKVLKKKGQLPIAPTVGPSTKPLPGAAPVVAEPAPSGARWAPSPLNARKLDDWQARQGTVTPAPDADAALINRSVSAPRAP